MAGTGRHRFRLASTDTVEEGVVIEGYVRMTKACEGSGFRDAAVIAPKR